MLVRAFPIINDKSRRYIFKNIWLTFPQTEKNKFSIYPQKCEASFRLDNEKVLLAPLKGDIYLNGELITTENFVSSGDKITFCYKDNTMTFMLQLDPMTAKSIRKDQEKRSGKQYKYDDIPINDKVLKDFNKLFRVTENSLGIKRRFSRKSVNWLQIDEIRIGPDVEYNTSSGIFHAIEAGINATKKNQNIAELDLSLSEDDPLFTGPRYHVLFCFRNKVLVHKHIDNRMCYLLSKVIEESAPLDLVNYC